MTPKFWRRANWAAAQSLEELILQEVDVFEAFLDGGPPTLQTLLLRGCRVGWSRIPSSPHLTTLHLHYPTNCGTSQVLLRYLRTVPLLENLELAYALLDGERTNHHDRVLLPRLQHLLVEGMLDVEVLNFFGGITIPSTAKISANMDGEEDGNTTPIESLTALQNCRSTSMPWDPTVLVITVTQLELMFDIYEDAKGEQSLPILHFIFNDPGAGAVVESSCTLFNLTNLTLLDINIFPAIHAIPPTLWSNTFGQLPNLRTLKVRGDTCTSFVKHLFDEGNTIYNHDGQPPSLSFPVLEVLALAGWDRSAWHPNPLISALKTRIDLGHRLQELILFVAGDHNCAGEDEEIPCKIKFRDLADTVEELLHNQL
ncbi:hypothetical protein BDN72DRAFT_902123 [Pluteus cervinus]|uniref:Uncharacterized protein n=1 Tax=Pluteus cervinus TaxID=181527 RepID=A0ACD3AFZ8_9AGAR|nr:hypothetical protein BDN72DRAFT_902123 [Pluteus cervinus]